MKIRECTVCDTSDPNREDLIPLCPCKKNYFDDGILCRCNYKI